MSPMNRDKQHMQVAARNSNSAAAGVDGELCVCPGSPGRGGSATLGPAVQNGLGIMARN